MAREMRFEERCRLRRHECRHYVVEPTELASHDDPSVALASGDDAIDGRVRVYLTAERANSLLEAVDQPLVAAVQPPHHLAALLVACARHPSRARPDVGGRQVVELPVELRVEHRLPKPLGDGPSGDSLEPLNEWRLVQLLEVLDQVGPHGEEAEAETMVQGKQRKPEEVHRRGGREELPVAVAADSRWTEAKLVAETKLVGEAQDTVVARQDHVVEAIDRAPGEVHGCGQAAEVRRALEQRDADALLRQAQGHCHPEKTTPDDADGSLPHATARPCL